MNLSKYSNNKYKRKINRVQRACFSCRKRKQGCEEERPCRRCIEKGIECIEVESKKKKKGKLKKKITINHILQLKEWISYPEEENLLISNFDNYKIKNSENILKSCTNLVEESNCLVMNNEINYDDNTKNEILSLDDEIKLNFALLLPFFENPIPDYNFYSFFEEDEDLKKEQNYIFEIPIQHKIDFSDNLSEENEDFDSFNEEIKYYWAKISNKLKKNYNFHRQFLQIKEIWREIVKSLRSLDWKKAQM